MRSTTRGEPKKRVAWLVVDSDGEPVADGLFHDPNIAAGWAEQVGNGRGELLTVVEATYPWPQKEAKRGK